MENSVIKNASRMQRKSICLFCSLGCGMAFRMDGEQVKEMGYDKENPICHGALCARGYYNLELLNHPQRLTVPQIGSRSVSWNEALALVSSRLKAVDPATVGIVVSALASNEEAYLAAKLAKTLGVKNISAGGAPADLEAYQGWRWEVPKASFGKVEGIDSAECLLLVGDILTRSPVLSQRVNRVKYGKRGNKIMVIDPNQSHTSWFATTHLRIKPGTEALVLAAFVKIIADTRKVSSPKIDLEKICQLTGIAQEAMIKAAKEFDAATSGYVIFVPSATKQRNDLIAHLSKVLTALSDNKKYLSFYAYGNNLGVNLILDQMLERRPDYREIMKKIEKGQIKNLLLLGENIFSDDEMGEQKIRQVEFVALASHFPVQPLSPTTLLLPLASYLEEEGSYLLADGRREEHKAIVSPVGARSNFAIIAELLNLKVNEEREKIRTQVEEMLAKGMPREKADLPTKLLDVADILPQSDYPAEEVFHFGDNRWVKKFFWYRVNSESSKA